MAALSVARVAWRDVPALRIAGGSLAVVVTELGGCIATVQRDGDTSAHNPLWQPPWLPYDPARLAHSFRGGDSGEASLLATIVGHNLCFDRFGPPHPGERRPLHGEVNTAVWACSQPARDVVRLEATLPEARFAVRRDFRIDGDSVHVETAVTPQDGRDRPVEMAEHVTIGGEFLDGASIAAGVDGAWNGPGPVGDAWRFVEQGPLGRVPVREALSMPPDDGRPWGDVLTTSVVDAWFEVANEQLGRRLRYEWNAQDFPWLTIWTESRSRTHPPWSGVARARGLEFSSKPFPEGKPPPERAATFQGRPTTMLVPAQGRRVSWTLSWTPL